MEAARRRRWGDLYYDSWLFHLEGKCICDLAGAVLDTSWVLPGTLEIANQCYDQLLEYYIYSHEAIYIITNNICCYMCVGL